MSNTIPSLKGSPRTVEVKGEDYTISVSYYPRFITPRVEALFAKIGDADAASGTLADILSAGVASWDLQGPDGAELPFSREALDDVPTSVALEIFNAIMEDARPKATSESASPAG